MKIYNVIDLTFKLILKRLLDFIMKVKNGKKALNGKMFVLVIF